jgi:hypothetical protein
MNRISRDLVAFEGHIDPNSMLLRHRSHRSALPAEMHEALNTIVARNLAEKRAHRGISPGTIHRVHHLMVRKLSHTCRLLDDFQSPPIWNPSLRQSKGGGCAKVFVIQSPMRNGRLGSLMPTGLPRNSDRLSTKQTRI